MTSIRVNPNAVARRVEDRVVVVNLQTNRIFSLSPTGARAWELLADGRSRDDIEQQLLREFDVTEADLAAEIEKLFADLHREGLVDHTE